MQKIHLLTALLVWGGLAHLVADWLLQNEWMVQHKQDLRHPAGWVHGAIHSLALLLFLPWSLALLIGLSHVLIDTRLPVRWWKRLAGKAAADPRSLLPQTQMVELAVDQVLHLVVLAAVVWMAYGR